VLVGNSLLLLLMIVIEANQHNLRTWLSLREIT
jgi:hypothetical protein